jgi:hypothetical protein
MVITGTQTSFSPPILVVSWVPSSFLAFGGPFIYVHVTPRKDTKKGGGKILHGVLNEEGSYAYYSY